MIKSLYKILPILTLCLGMVQPGIEAKKHIICDLGGVFIDTNTTAAFWHIGPLNYAHYIVTSWPKTRPTKKALFDTLHAIKPRHTQEIEAKDEAGMLLPQLMCDWLKGTHSCEEIIDTITQTYSEQHHLFMSHSERRILHSIAHMIFTPEHMIKTRMLYPSGVDFLLTCKEQGHKLYLLSNWDPASFELLKERFADFFDLFDGILISGECGLIKPDPAIYKLLMKTFKLKPKDCIFIDDQLDNVVAAQKLHIHGILCPKQKGIFNSIPDFDHVWQHIQNHHLHITT